MSEVTLNVLDSQRAIHQRVHGGFADSVVAALSAGPETIEELETALGRFIQPSESYGVFDSWPAGVCEEPWDAGFVLIDLAARLVVCRSSYSHPTREGEVRYHDGESRTDVPIRYCLTEEWCFSDNVEGWQALSERLREQLAATPPLAVRSVLYERVTEFIVSECLAAKGKSEDPIAEIHARWLMTPRADLRQQTPRELLLASHRRIDLDLQNRCQEWTFLGRCPPGLNQESAAYRFAGFGTHENVLYYELLRHLLDECWQRVSERSEIDMPAEIIHLDQLKQEWLHTPQGELQGYSPIRVMALERARLPMVLGPGQTMLDDDCPLCQMAAESLSPMFWHLDGCNMDDDFPFSFCPTREDWEEEQRRWEEYNREFEAEYAAKQAKQDGTADDDSSSSSAIWQHSYSDSEALGDLPPETATEIVLFQIAGHMAELQLDIKSDPALEPLISSFQSHFTTLRRAIADRSRWLVDAAAAEFCEDLDAIATARPDLADKCADLERQLDGLVIDD